MTNVELSELHQVQIEMMDDIHAFCMKHGIRYYLIAGTALGAVRHGGIIPWDVDMDIAMPRSDYQRFLNDYSSLLDARYAVLHFKNTPSLHSKHALIVMKNSNVIFNARKQDSPLYIDVFPLDACPDSIKLRKRQMNHLELLKTIVRYKRFRKGSNLFNTFIRKMISLVLSIFSVQIVNVLRDRIARRYEKNEEKAECWCSMCSKYNYFKQCMPQSYYGKPTLIDFEGRQYFVPERVVDHLNHLYGDFMKLPSRESQNVWMNYVKHVCWIDKNNILHEIG